MAVPNRKSLRDADVKIVHRTITEEYPDKFTKIANNNLIGMRATMKMKLEGGKVSEANGLPFITGQNPQSNGDSLEYEDDFVVIELVDEIEDEKDGSTEEEIVDDYIDVCLKTSKQLIVYLSKKRRCFVRCRSRAVSHSVVAQSYSTGLVIFYLEPYFRVKISRTEFWYLVYPSSVSIRPARRSIRRKPIHYTENVECLNQELRSPNTEKLRGDLSSYQLTFSDETSNEVSKLTLSADFTKSYEEKHLKLAEVTRDIDVSGEIAEPGLLRRSYSIEFLNEDKNDGDSFSSEAISNKIKDGCVKEIYDDDDSMSSKQLEESVEESSKIKRSFSIEFLNEDEENKKAFCSETVHYKIEKGEGLLVYSDLELSKNEKEQSQDEVFCESESVDNDEKNNLKRCYSVEILDEPDDKPSAFSYETVSNRIEKGEGKLIYDDSIHGNESLSVSSIPKRGHSQRLKTIDIEMDIDDETNDSITNQPSSYRIVMLNETAIDTECEPRYDEAFEEDIINAFSEESREIFEEENTAENIQQLYADDVKLYFPEDDLLFVKQSFDVKFIDEESSLTLDLDDKKTSTPIKNKLKSPKASPLRTVAIGLQFEKRNKIENEEDSIEDEDEYMVYDHNTSVSSEGSLIHGESHNIPHLKLKTIVVNMDTHHKRKRGSMMQDKRFQLEFKTERDQKLERVEETGQRVVSDNVRTVSVASTQEKVFHDDTELNPPQLHKQKTYSVEYFNEMEGDSEVFKETIVDDLEPKWKINF